MKKIYIIIPALIFLILFLYITFINKDTTIAIVKNGDAPVSQLKMINDGNEPPKNPYLADSPWPMTHRNTYNQASSPYPGPLLKGDHVDFHFKRTLPGIITIAYGIEYTSGTRAIWTATQRSIIKALSVNGKIHVVDSIVKGQFKWSHIGNPDAGISGAYNLVDIDNTYYVPGFTTLNAFGDIEAGDPYSEIELKRTFSLPADKISDNEKIVGITITYDGFIVIITDKGLLTVIDRDFKKPFYHRFMNEEISNSIACDENGGIYVVTSKYMNRVAWTGNGISISKKDRAWRAQYETGGDISGIRLGKGSGATPTLMGTGKQDKFVVITDGQKLMHLVLFWRNAIPANWKQLPGTRDRRIAAQVPVTFGNKKATRSLSEQSVCVRGYGALVVNNQLSIESKSKFWSIFRSGNADIAPYGIEKFRWDPAKRRLVSIWTNKTISFPNGIPSMSAATGCIYDVGQRNGTWTFEAVNWDTGKPVFHVPLGYMPHYNSTWAGTEIGPNGTIASGAALGFMVLGNTGNK